MGWRDWKRKKTYITFHLANSQDSRDGIHSEHKIRELDAHQAEQQRRCHSFPLAPELGEKAVAIVLVDSTN